MSRDEIARIRRCVSIGHFGSPYGCNHHMNACDCELNAATSAVETLLEELDAITDAAKALHATLGCGDHSCRFKKVEGMGTNGGCRCYLDRAHQGYMLRKLLIAAGAMEEK